MPPVESSLSALAILVSIVAIVLAWRTARRQNALQERLVVLEEARERERIKRALSAEVRASIERDAPDWRQSRLLGKLPQHRLVVRNGGEATARNLDVSLDGGPILDHPLILRGEDEVHALGPGAEYGYVLAVDQGSASIIHVRIEWNDDSDEPGVWESQLKV